MALYRGCTKVSGIGQSFNPENTGTEGQVLTKTNSGYAYCDPQGGGDDGPKLDVLVVAGGGGGGEGGGGGGAVNDCRKFSLGSDTSFAVVVGAGGNGALSIPWFGCNGGDSCFGEIVSLGGGGGAYYACCCGFGLDGGNGGGGDGNTNCAYMTRGGIGKQGYSGGAGGPGAGGGGGGAGGPGTRGLLAQCTCSSYGGYKVGGLGGQGYYNSFRSECLYGSGGGGGTSCYEYGYPGCAFPGGGNGQRFCGCNATYYGGGGGGGGATGCQQGNGCQGIVIVKYKTDGSCGIGSATGGTITTEGDYTVHTFTSDGTFCITG